MHFTHVIILGSGTVLELAEIPVQGQARNGKPMAGEFPFSWVVKDQIEELIHQAKSNNQEKGK